MYTRPCFSPPQLIKTGPGDEAKIVHDGLIDPIKCQCENILLTKCKPIHIYFRTEYTFRSVQKSLKLYC